MLFLFKNIIIRRIRETCATIHWKRHVCTTNFEWLLLLKSNRFWGENLGEVKILNKMREGNWGERNSNDRECCKENTILE